MIGQMMTKRVFASVTIMLLAGLTAQADVQLSGVFGDHMVLQRERPVPVYGTASPGESVTVTFGGKTVSTKANIAGRRPPYHLFCTVVAICHTDTA